MPDHAHDITAAGAGHYAADEFRRVAGLQTTRPEGSRWLRLATECDALADATEGAQRVLVTPTAATLQARENGQWVPVTVRQDAKTLRAACPVARTVPTAFQS